jgi:hypothetical protein
MSVRPFAIILVCLFVGAGTILWPGEAMAQTIVFTLEPETPATTKIQVLDSIGDVTPVDGVFANGSFSYVVKKDPAKWRNQPSFLITFRARSPSTDPFHVDDDEVTVRLDFSFAADWQGEDIVVPIGLIHGVGVAERNRIDNLSGYEWYQKIISAQVLALHYLHRLPIKQDAATRYMAKVWFETIYGSITDQNWPLRVSEDVQNVLNQAFADDADSLSHFAGARAQLRQAIWLDKDHVDALVEGRACGSAKDLVAALKANLSAHPGHAIAVRLSDAEDVVDRLAITATQCR